MVDENRIERAIAAIALILVALGCLATLWPFATSLLWAAITAFSTWPLFLRIERMLGGRTAAAAGLMALGAALILVAPLIFLASTLADSATALIALLGRWLEFGPPPPPAWIETLPLIGSRLHARWQEVGADGASFHAALAPHLGWMRNELLVIAASLGGGMAKLVLSLILTFFMYCHGRVLADHLRHSVARVAGVRGRRLEGIVSGTTRGVVYGILGTNLIQALLATIGFAAVGVPGAALLGLVCFFLTLIPFACNLIWMPAAIWVAADGHIGWAIAFAIWNILLFGPFETAMRAYVIGRNSELPMILLLMGMLGGLTIFGLLGLLIGPTLLAVGHVLLSEWSSAVPKDAATAVGEIGTEPKAA